MTEPQPDQPPQSEPSFQPQAQSAPAAPPGPAGAEEQGASLLGAAAIGLGVLAVLFTIGVVLLKYASATNGMPGKNVQVFQGVGFIAAFAATFMGLGLAIGGFVQKGASKVLPAMGLVLNGVLAGIIALIMALGLAVNLRMASRVAAEPAAVSTASVDARARADLEAKLEEEMGSAARAGYNRLTTADLVADPKKYADTRVYFSGFYTGNSPDRFSVFGLWAKGGMVAVDGSGLSVDKKKDLLVHLDGFHRVLIRGTFHRMTAPVRTRVLIPHYLGAGGPMVETYEVTADDVIDLGRDPNPNSP